MFAPHLFRLTARVRPAALLVFAALALGGCVPALSDLSPTGSLLSSRPKAEPLELNMFVVSTRPKRGKRGGDGGAHYSFSTVSVPPGHKAGQVELPTFGKAHASSHFVVTRDAPLNGEEFSSQLAANISGRVGPDRDVLIFVHGFNTSLREARLRLAQIVADGRFGGVPVLFTWPSSNSLFAYESDKQSATISRDALGNLLAQAAKAPGVGRVHVLAHSMGAWLAMEALREQAIAGNRTLGGHIGEVMLAAPDIDIGVFRQQMARLQGVQVAVFASREDRALGLSSRIAGARPRLGAIDASKPADRAQLKQLGVTIYDLSQFSSGFIGHGVYANTPAVVRTIGSELRRISGDEKNTTAIIDAGVTKTPQAPLMPGKVEASPLPDVQGSSATAAPALSGSNDSIPQLEPASSSR